MDPPQPPELHRPPKRKWPTAADLNTRDERAAVAEEQAEREAKRLRALPHIKRARIRAAGHFQGRAPYEPEPPLLRGERELDDPERHLRLIVNWRVFKYDPDDPAKRRRSELVHLKDLLYKDRDQLSNYRIVGEVTTYEAVQATEWDEGDGDEDDEPSEDEEMEGDAARRQRRSQFKPVQLVTLLGARLHFYREDPNWEDGGHDFLWLETPTAFYAVGGLRSSQNRIEFYWEEHVAIRAALALVRAAVISPGWDLSAFLHYLLNQGDAVFGSWSYSLFKTDLATSRDLVRKHLEECDELGDAASNDQLRRSQTLRDSDLIKQFLSPAFESAHDDLGDWGSIRVTPVVYRAARGMFRFPYRRWWKVVRPPHQPLPPGMEPEMASSPEEDSKVDLRYFVGPFQYDSDGDTVCDLDEPAEVQEVRDSPAPALQPRFGQRFRFDRKDEVKVEEDEHACAASKERYIRVQSDGVADSEWELQAGDFVRVLEPTKYALERFKEMKEREGKRVEAPKSCIVRLSYFYRNATNGAIYFHGQCFETAQIVLGLPGNQFELFATLECRDGLLAQISSPTEKIVVAHQRVPDGRPFCTRLFTGSAWVNPALYCPPAEYDKSGWCFVGWRKLHGDEEPQPRGPQAGQLKALTIFGVEYHLHDFVFLETKDGDPSEIVQVRQFWEQDGKFKVLVMPYDRGSSGVAFGERKLSTEGDTKWVLASKIVGKVAVVFEEPSHQRLHADSMLFFTDGRPGQTCNYCKPLAEVTEMQRRKFDDAIDHLGPLTMLDPFNGCGGLSLGIERGSSAVATLLANDIDEQTTRTYLRNTKTRDKRPYVSNLDANDLLERLVASEAVDIMNEDVPQKTIPEDQDLHVDIICVGVPCQSHSTLNQFRRAEDPKDALVLTALSFVECLRPRYFVLENVASIDAWRLMGMQQNERTVGGGEAHGGVYLIVSILLELGYQVRVNILQAGHFGAPQSRRRFILMAADDRSTLPQVPHPTHGLKTKTLLSRAFPNATPDWPTVGGSWRTSPKCIPHAPVTVDDAIGDLNPYDWTRPSGIHRNMRHFACRLGKGCRPEFLDKYAKEAETTFQHRAREEHAQNQPSFRSLQHHTVGFKGDIIENVWSISTGGDDNYQSLRTRQGFAAAHGSMGRAGYPGGYYYRRLVEDGHFNTLVGNVRPTAKQSRVIHPSQNRIISVREQARAQGFPDWFRFEGTFQQQTQQIVNAVPVPLAEAIGRAIHDAIWRDWLRDESAFKRPNEQDVK